MSRQLNVLLFAAARSRVGEDQVTVSVSENCTVAQLRTILVDQYSSLEPIAASLLFAVNEVHVVDTMVITDDAIVACFPPVSGG